MYSDTMDAAKPILLLFACSIFLAFTALVSSSKPPYIIKGSVYCDTCIAGFETSKTTYISGAIVKIECKERETLRVVYNITGTTNHQGKYKLIVYEDHYDQICNTVLVSCPILDCKRRDPLRSRSTITLTGGNGAVSNVHHANSMGCFRDTKLPGCDELVYKLLYSDV